MRCDAMRWDSLTFNPGKAADPGLVCAGRARCRVERTVKKPGVPSGTVSFNTNGFRV